MNEPVKSARRVLEILQYFAEAQVPATVDEIRTALNYPQSSTSRLLQSLTQLGYLWYEAEGRTFRPTLRVALLGDWIVDDEHKDRSPPAIMRRLRAATGETVVLGTRNGIHVIYVQVLQAINPVRFYMKPGAQRPISTTAVGRALLSFKSDKEILAIVRRANSERPSQTSPQHPSEVLEAIRKGQRQGYHFTRGIATPGAGVVAMPIKQTGNRETLAIGIGAPIDVLDREKERYVKLMHEELERATAGGERFSK